MCSTSATAASSSSTHSGSSFANGARIGLDPRHYADPVGIAVAPDDTVWVLDVVRSVVEHYAADGTVIGSFDPLADIPFVSGANSLAIDADGNLYVTLAGPLQVAMFEPSGRFVRFIGEGEFDEQPTHMAIDGNGRLFVTQGSIARDGPRASWPSPPTER